MSRTRKPKEYTESDRLRHWARVALAPRYYYTHKDDAPPGWCNFRKEHPGFSYALPAKRTPGYGRLSRGMHYTVRCPSCNKRLQVKAVYCYGGEWSGWTLPSHKARVTRNKGPRRTVSKNKRGG